MEILFTICGRAGSKGFKNKIWNIWQESPSPFALAMIDIYQQKHPEHNCTTCLNTDSNELVELTTKLNPSVKIVERKPELATDTVGKIEVIRDSFLQLEREDNIFDLIIDLDLTSPLREVSNLEELIDEHLKI